MAIAVPLQRSSRSEEGARTAALYRAHGAELLRFAWHRLGRLEDAEDAVQATFLSAHRVLAEGEHVREPRAWLFRILRNECLTRIAMTKRRGSHEPLEEWHADPRASVVEASESRDEFDVAVALLGTLPAQQREALVLREWLGMSAIETASILESTPQGVDALVYRARKSLVGVADVPDASTCADTRDALVAGTASTKMRAHLMACRSCRTAARRLRAPEELAVSGMLPLDSIASRIGESIPGFAAGATAAALAGTGAAATVASSLAAGTAVKIAAAVAIGAVVTGGAISGVPAVRNVIRPPANTASAPESSSPPKVSVQTAVGSATVAPPAKQEVGAAHQPASNGVGAEVASSGSAVVAASALAQSAVTAGPATGSVDATPANPPSSDAPATQPVTKQPEAKQSETKPPESKQPESKQPAGKQPESKQPESKLPESKQSESKQPESKQPESKQPAGKQPESKQPESKLPESKQPESKQPAGKQPESKQPESQQPQQSESSKGTIATPPVVTAPPVVPVVAAPAKHDGGDKNKSDSRDSQRD
ncbi:MAG: sigma-70 family RNA polymerase sigma factor [Thermoleophilia bacterium]